MTALCKSFLRAGSLVAPVVVGLLAGLACNGKPAAPAVEEPGEAAPSGPPLFQDITATSGVTFTYRNGEEADRYTILESLGGGVALIDFDRDGRLDLFLPGGGTFTGRDRPQIVGAPCRFYRNLGGNKFKDVTAEVGLAGLADGQPWFYTHGVAVADYDRDGWPDLLVTGYAHLALFHNESDGKGGRRFRDVTRAAGLDRGAFWPTSAAFADLDGDGWPELYICQYVDWSWQNDPPCPGYTTGVKRDVCPPKQFNAVAHLLYRNNGGRAFTDVSKEAGLRPDGKGLGVLVVDVDGDGKPDIYVANDTTDNFLYLNQSTSGKVRLVERGLEMGVARDGNGNANGSMGVDAADFDHSGHASLWVTNYEGELHALYRAFSSPPPHKRLIFTHATQPCGLAVIGQDFVGFGTAFIDLDGDAHEDIVISNGHVVRFPGRSGLCQRPVLFRNKGDATFTEVTPQGGDYFLGKHRGRGLAVGDLDNDGRPDLVFTPVNEPVRLLRNVAPSWKNWLGLELAGRDNADIVGARLVVEVGGRRLTRFVKGGGSYLSASDPRHLIGLGDQTRVERVTVHWPSGEPRTQEFTGLSAGRYWQLVQGKKDAEIVRVSPGP